LLRVGRDRVASSLEGFTSRAHDAEDAVTVTNLSLGKMAQQSPSLSSLNRTVVAT